MDIYLKRDTLAIDITREPFRIKNKDGTIIERNMFRACAFPNDDGTYEDLTQEVLDMPLNHAFTLLDREFDIAIFLADQTSNKFKDRMLKFIDERMEKQRAVDPKIPKMPAEKILKNQQKALKKVFLKDDPQFNPEGDDYLEIPEEMLRQQLTKTMLTISDPSYKPKPTDPSAPFTPVEYAKIKRSWQRRDCFATLLKDQLKIKKIDKTNAWFSIPDYEISSYEHELKEGEKLYNSGRLPTVFRFWTNKNGTIAFIQDGRENEFKLCNQALMLSNEKVMIAAKATGIPKESLWECVQIKEKEVTTEEPSEETPEPTKKPKKSKVEPMFTVGDHEIYPYTPAPDLIQAKKVRDLLGDIREMGPAIEISHKSKYKKEVSLRDMMKKARERGELVPEIEGRTKLIETKDAYRSEDVMKKEASRIVEFASKKHFGDLLEISTIETKFIPFNLDFHVLGDPSTIAIEK